MQTLHQEDRVAIDISTAVVSVVEYTTTKTAYISTLMTISNISGDGGNYVAKIYVDDVLLCPDKSILIAPSDINIHIQSRAVLVLAGSTLTIKIKGLVTDTTVDTETTVVDVTPTHISEINDEIIPTLVEATRAEVISAASSIQIIVRPETKVLGACSRQTVTPLLATTRTT